MAGKQFRKGLSLSQLFQKFPNDDTARQWIESIVWANGVRCPFCQSTNVQSNIAHKSMSHRCRKCVSKPRFSVKTRTVVQGSKLGYQTWAVAIYLMTMSSKSVSSMKLSRDLNIRQKSAWHLAHRLRKTYENGQFLFEGQVEVDEAYLGGKEKNKHASKELHEGRGGVNKSVVTGTKDRETKNVVAKVISKPTKETVQNFVEENTSDDAQVFTDESRLYNGINRKHQTVCHSVGEYVNELAHTNGIESFWAILKRSYQGTFHKIQ